MAKIVSRSVILLAVMVLLTGILYPMTITGIARLLFPVQANGSIIYTGNRAIGSAVIGQNFTSTRYFHGRPSAAGTGYDASASGGSNLGPTNKKLLQDIAGRAESVRQLEGLSSEAAVPSDLVEASGSGLDPDISPESAYLQAARVAKARRLPEGRILALIRDMIKQPQLGILGEPRVNVLELNRALDKLQSR